MRGNSPTNQPPPDAGQIAIVQGGPPIPPVRIQRADVIRRHGPRQWFTGVRRAPAANAWECQTGPLNVARNFSACPDGSPLIACAPSWGKGGGATPAILARDRPKPDRRSPRLLGIRWLTRSSSQTTDQQLASHPQAAADHPVIQTRQPNPAEVMPLLDIVAVSARAMCPVNARHSSSRRRAEPAHTAHRGTPRSAIG